MVWELLRADWSPEQIAAKLPELSPDGPDLRVGHETIYQSLFVQTKGELKRESSTEDSLQQPVESALDTTM